MAGAPVTSWQLYDTGYTERYLDRLVFLSNNPIAKNLQVFSDRLIINEDQMIMDRIIHPSTKY